MAKGIITDAAGATTEFFYTTGAPREESISDHKAVLSAIIRQGPHKGERATITFKGEFDIDEGVANVTEMSQSVGGKAHFVLKFDHAAPLEDLLFGTYREPLNLVGNDFANLLEGDVTADRLTGKGGADRLFGDRGADVLAGGEGADVFLYKSVRDSTLAKRDVIRDFDDGADLISVKAIDADATRAGNQAFVLIDDDRFSGVAGELRVVATAKATAVLGDTDGDGVADFALRLVGSHALDADSFLL